MTNAQIARAYSDLPESLARVALLCETLEMGKEMKLSQAKIDAARHDEERLNELLVQTGLPKEIEAAEQTITQTMVALIEKISEQDLEAGRDKGLLSAEDYQEALTAKRTMELARVRPEEPEQEREA